MPVRSDVPPGEGGTPVAARRRGRRAPWLPCWTAVSLAVWVCAAAAPLRAEDPVLVNITGPLAAKLGEKVSFEVELVNRSGRPLQGLRVIDYFDRGFHHAASASPIEQKGTIDMAAGTSRRMQLEFFTDEPGRQCHRVEILDQAHNFMGGATECVMVTPPTAPAVAAAPPALASSIPPPVVPPAPAFAPAPVPAPVSAPVFAPPVATVPPPVAPPLVAPAVALPLAAAAPVMVPPSPTLAPTAALPGSPSLPPPLRTAPTVPSLQLGMSGPGELTSGGVGEFVATVRNIGAVPSGPTSLEFDWDPAYSALEASDGYVLGTNSVSWTLPPMEPGGQLRRQINLRAQATAGLRAGQASRACVRGVLNESVGGVMFADESCVLVRSNAPALRSPRETGLRISVADLEDPVQTGGATTLVCTVSNNGAAPTGRLKVVVTIPEQARLVGDPNPARVVVEGRTLIFDSVAPIQPGGHASFEMTYRISPGVTGARATAVATVSGADLEGSLEADCTTTFLGP